MGKQNYINHIALVLDASASMGNLADPLIKVTDSLVADLVRQSKNLDQETRVTIYSFDTDVKCLIWDMDVLRVPSIASLYQVNPNGWTALIDATLTAIQELQQVTQIHGDHSFLAYILTDGEENRSRNRPLVLSSKIAGLPDNWTMGALVPNFNGVASAKMYGFPAGNVITWDTSSVRGVEEVGEKISAATTTYMTQRSTGTRSTTTLFGGSDQVNAQTVAALGLKPLDYGKFQIVHVPTIPDKTWISDFVRDSLGLKYVLGAWFYELTKRERIQASKQIAVVEIATDKVYVGREARQLLGLPDTEVRVSPGHNAKYKVFVQSNSMNRHLVENTKLLNVK